MKLPSRKVCIIIAVIFTFGGLVNPIWFIVVALAILGAIRAKPVKKGQDVNATETNNSIAATPNTQFSSVKVTPVVRHVSESNVKRYHIAIERKYIGTINEICGKNEDYPMSKNEIIDVGLTDDRIYEYNYFEKVADLCPVDDKWIDVMVKSKCIGKIAQEDYEQVKSLIDSDKIKKVVVSIYGGKYKVVEFQDDFDDTDTFEPKYVLERGETDRTIKVAVFLK